MTGMTSARTSPSATASVPAAPAPHDSTGSTGGLEDLERALSVMLRRLSDRGTAGDLAARSGVDLPPASWSLLEHLEARGSLRVSQIAACHGVDVSSVTPRLQRLENAGLVERKRAPGDGRVSIISLAPDGVRALQRIHQARCEILRGAADGIDDAALAAAADVLGRIGAELSADETDRGDGTDGRD